MYNANENRAHPNLLLLKILQSTYHYTLNTTNQALQNKTNFKPNNEMSVQQICNNARNLLNYLQYAIL